MDMFIVKSVAIRGNLKKGKLSYKPFPAQEFFQLKWISIGSIAFIAKDQVNTVCTISCNFVKSQCFDSESRPQSYEEPLQSFLISNKNYQLNRYSFNWFLMNSITEELIFTIRNFENQKVSDDIDVVVIVNFR